MKTITLLFLFLLTLLAKAENIALSVYDTTNKSAYIAFLDTATGKITKVAELPLQEVEESLAEGERRMRDILWIDDKITVWNGSFKSRLSVYDLTKKVWAHRTLPEHSISNGAVYGGLFYTDKVYVTSHKTAFNKTAGVIIDTSKEPYGRLLPSLNTGDVYGDKEYLYVLAKPIAPPFTFGQNYRNVIRIALSDHFISSELIYKKEIYAICSGMNNSLFLATESGVVEKLTKWGDIKPEKTLSFDTSKWTDIEKKNWSGIFTDLDTSVAGTLSIGAFSGKLFVTNTNFEGVKMHQVTPQAGRFDTVFTCFQQKTPEKKAPEKKESGGPRGLKMVAGK